MAIALAGIGAAYAYYWLGAGPQRLAERNPLARAGKHFLVMKYYLDVLYTDIIVGSIKGPIADGVYWVNQHVIDNVLELRRHGRVGSSGGSRTSTSISAVSTVSSTVSRP